MKRSATESEPCAGDIVGFRDKPNRTVVNRFTDACGGEWIDYTITKQIRLEAWKRAMRGAIVVRKVAGQRPPQANPNQMKESKSDS